MLGAAGLPVMATDIHIVPGVQGDEEKMTKIAYRRITVDSIEIFYREAGRSASR